MSEIVGVVGSNGFIGRAVTLALEEAGTKALGFNSKNPVMTKSGELNENLLQTHSVIWCATSVNPALAERSPERVTAEITQWRTFIMGWKNSAAYKQIPIIFISSGGCVYSDSKIPFTERSARDGINAYGKMKSTMERILEEAEIAFKILRVANVYGPGQPVGRGQGVIAEWINSSKKIGRIEVYGSLGAFRDYIYIDDVTSAIISCLETPHMNGSFNIGSGTSTTLEEVLNQLTKLCSHDLEILHRPARLADRLGYFLDITEARKQLAWQPKIHLNEGLENCFDQMPTF